MAVARGGDIDKELVDYLMFRVNFGLTPGLTLGVQSHENQPRKAQKKRLHETVDADLKWCHSESNQGHKDFQSFALPTELWHPLFAVQR